MDVLSPSRVKMWSRSAEPKQVKKKEPSFRGDNGGKFWLTNGSFS